MKLNKIIKFFSLLLLVIIIPLISIKFFYNGTILDTEKRLMIKKYFFPYKRIAELDKIIADYDKKLNKKFNVIYQLNLEKELGFRKNLKKVNTNDFETIQLKNNLTLSKYKELDGFYAGINNINTGAGYLDFHNDNLIILSSRGIIAHQIKNDKNKLSFEQIPNNIDDFINQDQYTKYKWFSLKDLHIFNNKIYISFTEEIKENCWNTSVIFSEMNYEKIIFKKIFSTDKCNHSKENIDKRFNAHQSGGRIISIDNDHIVLSVGDYRNLSLAQNKNSINGKNIKININDSSYEIISMGHRNVQGIVYDKKNNFLLSTEHGPMGGDEINLIKLNDKNVPNYGWSKVSYGEHYGLKSKNKELYKKYPLFKSHKKYNFIEPLKYFVPSIAISEIIQIKDGSFVTSSLKDRSLYFFNFNYKNEIENFSRIEVYERVRDMIFKNDKIFLFLEDSASIGIINLNS